jgi:hypothetical protein
MKCKSEKNSSAKIAIVKCLYFFGILLALLIITQFLGKIFLEDNSDRVDIHDLLWYPAILVTFIFAVLIAWAYMKDWKRSHNGFKEFLIAGTYCLLSIVLIIILHIVNIEDRRIFMCTITLRNFSMNEYDYISAFKEKGTALKWCDFLKEHRDPKFLRFKCPGDKVGPCSYAINKDFREADELYSKNTVYLFESKPGWNLVGGKELLNLDNHNGKGCTIMFGSGRIEFVTADKIEDLIWQPPKRKRPKTER